jgi:hypothetical protein
MWKKTIISILVIVPLLWLVYSFVSNGKDFLTLLLNASGIAGAAAIIGIFYSKGEKEKKETEEIKHEPESISSINGVQKIVNKLKEEAFSPFKRYKFKRYILPIPQTHEEFKKTFEEDQMLGILGTEQSLVDRGIDRDYADVDLLEKFYKENGGQDNFGLSYSKGLKLPSDIYMLAYKNVYTYSKKGKAVFIKEEFRRSDNTFNIWVFCTKNHGITL